MRTFVYFGKAATIIETTSEEIAQLQQITVRDWYNEGRTLLSIYLPSVGPTNETNQTADNVILYVGVPGNKTTMTTKTSAYYGVTAQSVHERSIGRVNNEWCKPKRLEFKEATKAAG